MDINTNINTNMVDSIIAGLEAMPKKSEIDTPTNNIDKIVGEDGNKPGLMSIDDKEELDRVSKILENIDANKPVFYTLPVASKDNLGGVTTTSIVPPSDITEENCYVPTPIKDGVPYYRYTTYSLPTASETELGGVKIGDNISISSDGVISVPDISASNMTGILPVSKGGTGASNIASARLNLKTSCFVIAGNTTSDLVANSGYYKLFSVPSVASCYYMIRLLISPISSYRFEEFVVDVELSTSSASKNDPKAYITSIKDYHKEILENLYIVYNGSRSDEEFYFWYRNRTAYSLIRVTILQCVYSKDTIYDGIQNIKLNTTNPNTPVDTIPTSTPNVISFSDIVSTKLATRDKAGYMSKEDKAKVDTIDSILTKIESHIANTNMPHTPASIGLDKVENKSSATIRGEITKANVTRALGYTPVSSVTFTQSLTSGIKIGTLNVSNDTTNDYHVDLYAPDHYTTNLIVGASDTASANAAVTSNGVYLNLFDNSTLRNAHKITGSTGVTVTSDSSGNITIKGTTYLTRPNPYALTIQGNGSDIATYNGSSPVTANITPANIGALPITGGTVTGDLTVTGSTTIGNVLTMNDSKHTRNVICIYDDEDDHNYGSELCIEGAGNLFIGSGESANNLRNAFKSGLIAGDVYGSNAEQAYLSSDGAIFFYSNVQTPADRRGIIYDGNGILRPLVTDTRQLGSSSYYWNKAYITNIYGSLRGNATSASKVTGNLTIVLDGEPLVYNGSCNEKIRIALGDALYGEVTITGDEVIAGGTEGDQGVTAEQILTICHEDYITAGTASGSDTKSLTFGGTFDIPTITYNAQGHIIDKGVTTMTMPTKLPKSLTIKTNGTSAAVFDGSLAKTVNITPASIGAAVDNKLTNQDLNTVTAPGFYNAAGGNTVTNKPSGITNFGLIVIHRAGGAYYTQIIFDPTSSYRRFCENGTWGEWTKDELTDTVTTVTTDGNGNAITAITADSDGKITATKGTTFLTAHPTISKSTNTTSTAYPAVGGSFAVIDSVTQDKNGHVTKVNTKTVTLPQVYATCATARATVDKVATLANFTLTVGARVLVKFTDTGTADPTSGTLTLNVNNTGAKQIRYVSNGYTWALNLTVCNRLSNNYTQCFTYDGTYWIIEVNADANNAVTNTLNTTTKAYITGTTSATTNTGGQIFDTGVYLDTTAGRLTATSFKENGLLLQDKYKIWRKALVGQNANCTTNPYYKFASISLSSTNDDQSITFKVSTVFGDATTVVGILTAHVRTDSNGYWSTGELVWEYAVSGVDISKFIYAHNASTNPAVVELWACVNVAYRVYHFDVISENSRTSTYNPGYWTLYTTITNTTSGNLAAVTAGYTTFASKLATLKNSTQGYAGALSTGLAITTSRSSGSYLDGNKGVAIINSTAGAGAYTVLAKLNSTNGYFTDGVYKGGRMFYYTAKTTVDAGTNATTKTLTLLDEAGNSSFPGNVWMMNGVLHINPGSATNYTEGIRIHSAANGYTSIALCGTDNTGNTGTSAKTWSIHTLNGNFYISNNGSASAASAATKLSCESGVWKANKNEILHAGNCASYFIFSGDCATASSDLAKVVTGVPNFTLKVGTTIAVNFTDTGTTYPTSGNFTLNVNDTGEIPMGYSRTGVKTKLSYSTATIFRNRQVHFFTYTGAYWLCMDFNVDDFTRHVLNNGAKAYLTGTTSASSNTGQQVFDNGVYLTTTAGQMNATTYKVAEKVTMQYNTSEQCLNFVFS